MVKKITAFAAAFSAAAFIINAPSVSAYSDLKLVKDCGTDYGYEYLAKRPNAENAQKLYNEIYTHACDLWQNGEDLELNEDGDCIFATFKASDYGFDSYTDLLEVLLMMKYDNPVLYFVSNTYLYSDTTLTLLVDQEYIKGEDRLAIQDEIYEYVTKTSAELNSIPSSYGKAKAMHDKLIAECEYELDGEGKPSKRHAAHNILGMIQDKTGVCDSFAKTFSMVMNHEDIGCLFVAGRKTNSLHSWDVVKLDDGEYYYFDCSADENFSKIEEIPDDFFVAAGTEKIDLLHKPFTPEEVGREFLYELPAVPLKDFDPSKIPSNPEPDNKYELGDVNRDKTIDIEDVVVLIGYLNGNNLLDDDSLADINHDGKVDIEDAVGIVGYVNGIPF